MVEKWLQQVERVMLASMREVISRGIEAYVQVNKNQGARARVLVQPHGLWEGGSKWVNSDHPSVFYQNPP